MVDPGAGGLSGASGNPITVKALNEGAVIIDGQFVNRPINLDGNNWWVVEGVNAKNGSDCVICILSTSQHNVIRRAVVWDIRADANGGVVAIHNANDTLLEDVAAFGVGRKTFTNSQGGNQVTCRRCWFRWEGSIFGGPVGVTVAYNSVGAVFENTLVNWNGISMPQTYTSASSGASITNFQPDGSGSVFTVDRIDCNYDTVGPCPAKESYVAVRGSMVYIKATDRYPSASSSGGYFPRFHIAGISAMAVSDLVSVMAPSHPRFNYNLGISLRRRPHNCAVHGDTCEDAVVGNTATRLTSIRGETAYGSNVGDSFGTSGISGYANERDWMVTNVSAGPALSAVQVPWQNTSTNGARLCYQTENNVVDTTKPLWPWPMNDRIKTATASAGAYNMALGCPGCTYSGALPQARTQTDVTAEIEGLLGVIPASCRR